MAARARALAVLRIRSTALAVALLPAAVAVVLLAGRATGHLGAGTGWDLARWITGGLAVVSLLLAALVAVVVARARPALSPSVPISEKSAPDLYRLVRDLADRLEVPAPSAIALTPDCDSWLEDRTHRAHGPPRRSGAPAGGERRVPEAPVLVIGSPFLWWMRVAELRALLAPVVAGTGPSSHPDIAAARRFIRGLDAAVAVAARARRPVRDLPLRFVGRVARLLLRAGREHATIMERAVATAASERAQTVDYGLRIVAQEQVGLAYAGWDRLLTRVALPAWRMGRWPSRLDAGVVSALTELSRRDRLADGFASRLGERPACDLLEEPGAIDRAASLLAARLFHGGPAEPGPDWSPVGWNQYPEEVVDRKWRLEAARLHRVLDNLPATALPAPPPASAAPAQEPASAAPPLSYARTAARTPGDRPAERPPADEPSLSLPADEPSLGPPAADRRDEPQPAPAPGPTLARVIDRLAQGESAGDLVAARLGAEVEREEREEAARQAARGTSQQDAALGVAWGDGMAEGGLPLFPLQPPRTGRELLADHVTAMVCCAAVDTAGAAPGLDWLDGPALLVDGARRADLGRPVLSLVDDGDAEPLRGWLTTIGVRPEKPVRLV
ncbi:membrane protein [Streptomyces platensis subsp. clarensis]|nr:membrane protein [Streptomyces platensis subsp. clarensis]